jgi:hypothetical protein
MVEEVKQTEHEELEEDDLEDNPEPEVEINISKKINPDEEKDYLIKALESGDEKVLTWVKYNAIGLKQKEGKSITNEEKQFMEDMNKLFAIDKEMEERQQEEKNNEEELKAKVLEEYNIVKEADPSKIDAMKKEDKSYRGGDSIPKLIKFALAMKKVKKKGGKVLVKITRDRQFFIEWTNKDVAFVTFGSKDEKGNIILEVTRFQEYKYTYEGSPIPVLFAVQGYSLGFDFFDKYKKDITSEMVSRIASRAYHSGYLEGVNLRDKANNKNDVLGLLTKFMPLILIIGLIAILYLLNQNYESMKIVYSTMETMQVQMNTLVPQVDVNALILR